MLKGIDAQIMAQRVMDAAKDAVNINKRNELMQDFMALERNAEDIQQDTMVNKLERKDEVRITKEHRGAGHNSAEEQNKRKRKRQTVSGGNKEGKEPGIVGSSKIDIII